MAKKTVYFLCTGNSCRSQMAEGFARHYSRDTVEVRSAGIEAHGLNPRAVTVMGELGIDISQQRSEVIDPAVLETCDVVVTLCGEAAERCPVTPPQVQREHWPLADPAKAMGSEDDVLIAFRQVRDAIGHRVERLLKALQEG